VLPSSSHARKGRVKRAVSSQAVELDVKELQLCLPGSFRHLADGVGACAPVWPLEGGQ